MADKKTFRLRGDSAFRKDIVKLNDLSRNLLDTASNSDTVNRDKELNKYMDTIEDIIASDYKKMSVYSSEDLSRFLVNFLNNDTSKEGTGFDLSQIEDVFENESNGLLQQFQTQFQNQLAILEDLNMITSQFNELQEAIDITRDSILSADDQSNTVSREFVFATKTDGRDDSSYASTVEAMEKEHKLLKRIKSHIVPNTLRYGKYYAYVVPYNYVFTKHANRVNSGVGESTTQSVLESTLVDFPHVGKATTDSISDSYVKEVFEHLGVEQNKINSRERKNAKDALTRVLEGITVDNSDLTLPIMENVQEVEALMQIKKATVNKSTKPKASDGVVDTGKIDNDFGEQQGCFVKLIDPRKIIPVRVLEQTVGYYYIHEEAIAKSRTPFTSTFNNNMAGNFNNHKEDDFITKIAERIVKSFDKPFLEKNSKFKKTIAAAIMHNDIYKKNIRFQFIPAEYMTEFKVNEDENDEGTSILFGSIFYAKLYLSLLLFNMMTIISKSNDQRLYYVHTSGVEKGVANKIQSAARQIKSREINYTDLFNYRSMVSKVGAGRDAYIPVGTDSRQGITFDILAGQDVELYSELMTQLKTSAINSTGVPSVIMNYVNEADYAKSIVMGNLRFLARVMSLQLDFNDSISDLYRKIMKYSTSLDEDVITGFSFKLAKPRSLDATNLAELINNSDALAKFIVETIAGENSDADEVDNKAKDITTRKIIKQITSMLGWTNFEEIYDDSVLEARKILKERAERTTSEA